MRQDGHGVAGQTTLRDCEKAGGEGGEVQEGIWGFAVWTRKAGARTGTGKNADGAPGREGIFLEGEKGKGIV